MISMVKRYTRWLHTKWPAGTVEKLPRVNSDGSTNVPGLYIVGDLTGIPLLKFAADSGARCVQTICNDRSFQSEKTNDNTLDLAIVGAGVSGMSAALEARKQGLRFQVLEASEPFSTITNFPKGKPIYTYPTEMVPAGDIQFKADVKEALVDELQKQTLGAGIEPRGGRVERINRHGNLLEVVIPDEQGIIARRVIIAIGQSGNYRKLGVPGEQLNKVYNRLHDPKDYAGQGVVVVGGGDSALEAAIALTNARARVTLSYRKAEFSRPKPDNLDGINALVAEGNLTLMMASKVAEIRGDEIDIVDHDGKKQTLPNDSVFAMIGREPPLDFLRRCGVKLQRESTAFEWLAFAAFFIAIIGVYEWKNDGFLAHHLSFLSSGDGFPSAMPAWLASLGDWWQAKVSDRTTVIGTLAVSMKSRSFYYTLVYTLAIGIFGIMRIRRRKTPYVTVQTITLFLVQAIPLFLLPEVILPLMGYNGLFTSGFGVTVADNLFPRYISEAAYAAGQWPDWGHPRAYWHAYGFILAWPLSVYNVFTSAPMVWWLVISFVQTFVIIPLLVLRWGKGAYCGWICSCGALAETVGDTQRHKMPHGPGWNRLNMLGQVILFAAFALLIVRIWGWLAPESWANRSFALLLEGKNADGELANPIAWKWVVDVLLGGILGVGLYFKYSGRVWCRFACPLAALMHIYARFTSFRILAEKKKCISCNVCTSVCHQGIDIMNFANKGKPMEDPECVRCSACVQSCPTGVLQFGRVNRSTGEVIAVDRLGASPVLMAESAKNS